MKKAITPIISIIVLLLITVALAGGGWVYLSGHMETMTKLVELPPGAAYCTGNRATVAIRNPGDKSINNSDRKAMLGLFTPDANTVGLWHFEGDGNAAFDFSGNENTGSIYGDTVLLMHFDESSGFFTEDASSYGNIGTFGQTKHDSFDTKNISFWTFDAAYQTVPYNLDGNNVVKMWSDGSSWRNFYQATPDITTGEEVYFEFQRTAISSWHYGALETTTGDYDRWSIQDDNTGVIRVQQATDGVYSYPKTLISSAKTGIWYSAILRVDDVNGFYIKVWEKDNPSVYGEYSNPSMPAGETWRFRSWQWLNIDGYIDNFRIRSYTADPSWSSGCKSGSCLEFDGQNDYVDVGNDLGIGEDELTVSAWVKHNAWGVALSSRPYVSDWNTWAPGNQKGFLLRTYQDDKTPKFSIGDGVNYHQVSSSQELTLGDWYYVVGVFKANEILKIYINGVERGSASAPNKYVAEISTPVYIGKSTINTGYFNGTIDEVAIYNRSMTGDEINASYKAGRAKFIERGKLGRFGYAMEFDGDGDYVDSSVDISWDEANSVSWSFWIKPNNGVDTHAGILGKIYNQWEWAFYQDGTNVKLVYWNSTGSHGNGMDAGWGNVLEADKWTHLVYTWDGSTSKFYADGVLKNTHTATDPSTNQDRTNNVMMGGHIYVWADKYFNGTIDEVVILNKSLSPQDIQAQLTPACSCSGNTCSCGELIIAKTSGEGYFHPYFDGETISPKGSVRMTDYSCMSDSCSYRITSPAVSVEATVSC